MSLDKNPSMVSKLRLVFTFTMVFFSFYGMSQDILWRQETGKKEINRDFSKKYGVQNGTVFSFDEAQFKRRISSLSTARNTNRTVHFPNEDGQMIAFQISEAPVLSPELSKKYPQIKSYVGYALNESKDKIRFSICFFPLFYFFTS